MNLLLGIFTINMFLLIFGITISWYDIRVFGSGLYLALVSIVTVVIVLAFCLVGTDEQTQPTVAKQMWSKSQQTIRRYATVRRPLPGQIPNLELLQIPEQAQSENTSKVMLKIEEDDTPRRPQVVWFNEEVNCDQKPSSTTPSASTSEQGMTEIPLKGKPPNPVIYFEEETSNEDSGITGSENAVIYL